MAIILKTLMPYHFIQNTWQSGFSLTPYSESFTPTFGLGTPVFPRISSNLHCGTPTFSKRCLWDSCFQNPSENPCNYIDSTNAVPLHGNYIHSTLMPCHLFKLHGNNIDHTVMPCHFIKIHCNDIDNSYTAMPCLFSNYMAIKLINLMPSNCHFNPITWQID